MALEIYWSKPASNTFHKTVEYLKVEWSEQSAKKFVLRVQHFIELLKKNPGMGRMEFEEKGIRGYVVSRHITAFYRIKNEKIILLKFFDNRQHPLKKISS